MGKLIETVTPPSYRYVAQCSKRGGALGCHFRVGANDLHSVQKSCEAHAFASGHTVTIEETEERGA